VDYANAGGFDIATADVTGDDVLDLVTVGGPIYGFKVLPGNGSGGAGDGTFGSAQDYTAGFGPGLVTGQWGVLLGDFDVDSRQDVAIANRYTENVSITLNNGSGFETAVKYALFAGSSPRAIASGFFNGDNVPDLAVADFGTGGNHATDHWISVLLGDAGNPGTFLPEVKYDAVYQNNPFGVTPADIVAADFDGDGKTDLATANTSSDDIDVFLGNGDGTFQTGVHYGYDALDCISNWHLAAGDLNGDLKPDIACVCSSHLSERLAVFLNQGGGTFPGTQSPLIVQYPTGGFPRDPALADLNGDGHLDAVVANYGTGGESSISVLEGNGDGTFKARIDYATGSGAYSEAVTVGDFNGDGMPDIAVVNVSGNTTSVFINDTVANPPPPTLSAVAPATATTGAGSVTLTVTGTNFFRDSVIRFDGSSIATTYSSPSELNGTLTGEDLAAPGSFPVTVFTPGPGGGSSNAVDFSVVALGEAGVPLLSTSGAITLIAGILLVGVARARRNSFD